MSWIDANQQVPELFKFTGRSLPVLVIAETDDGCFQQTMATYGRGAPRGRYPYVWLTSRFDDNREGKVIVVRCWMLPPKSPRSIPGNWGQAAIHPEASSTQTKGGPSE